MYNFSNNHLIPIAQYKEKLCNSYEKAIRDNHFTFENYQMKFATEIISKNEFPTKHPHIKSGKGFTLLDSDFIFRGNLPKKKSFDYTPLIWDDVFSFVVRKINGKWKIISID